VFICHRHFVGFRGEFWEGRVGNGFGWGGGWSVQGMTKTRFRDKKDRCYQTVERHDTAKTLLEYCPYLVRSKLDSEDWSTYWYCTKPYKLYGGNIARVENCREEEWHNCTVYVFLWLQESCLCFILAFETGSCRNNVHPIFTFNKLGYAQRIFIKFDTCEFYRKS
jgi:hypothetical protein